jgi:hypothetical protein
MEPRMWVWKNVDAEREEVKLGRMKAEAVSKKSVPLCAFVLVHKRMHVSDHVI